MFSVMSHFRCQCSVCFLFIIHSFIHNNSWCKHKVIVDCHAYDSFKKEEWQVHHKLWVLNKEGATIYSASIHLNSVQILQSVVIC